MRKQFETIQRLAEEVVCECRDAIGNATDDELAEYVLGIRVRIEEMQRQIRTASERQ